MYKITVFLYTSNDILKNKIKKNQAILVPVASKHPTV